MAPLPPHLSGRLPEGARRLLVARLGPPWPEALLTAARAAADAGQEAEAVALAEAALDEAPGDTAHRLKIALLHARLARPAAARAVAAPAYGAAATDPVLTDLLGMTGDTLRRIGAVEAAVDVLRHAWRASPRPLMRRSFLDAALPAYRRSLNEGADTALLAEMAEAAAGAIAAMPEEALAELARLVEEAGRGDLLRTLGAAAIAAGDNQRARLLAAIGEAAPNEGGLLHLATHRPARAGIAFALAHHLAPADPAARFNAGYAALAAGDPDAAAAILAPLPAADEAAMAGAAWPSFGELPWPFARPPAGFEALLPAGASWPRIRLVTPCFNPGPWLEETILSVAAQGYPAVEHVIVDAGSTDGTAALIARHSHHLHHVISEPDNGPAEAICKGFAGSDADLLGWINADDLLAPGALHRLGAAFARAPEVDIVHGSSLPHRGRRILGHQTPLADGPDGFTTEALGDVFGRWAEGRFFLQPEALVARRFWEKLGGRLDTSLSAVFDYELWLRAAAERPRILQVPWPAAFYRIHAAQRTAARTALADEQVAVRDRVAAPAPPPARQDAIRARLRGAMTQHGRPVRLLLIDAWCAETTVAAAREDARAALAAEGVALEIRGDLPGAAPGADLVVRLLRAHDGADWVAPLRDGGFLGPVVGWLIEDDRDAYANAATARGLDIVVPSRAARRSALLQDRAIVLPALTPPCGTISAVDAAAMPAGPATMAATDREGLVRALLAGSVPVLDAPGLATLFTEAEHRSLPLLRPGETPPPEAAEDRARRHRYGQSLLLAPRLAALLKLLRHEVLQGA
ncbi:glycosyltransferase [Roseomonas sp. JC162]|uniref:Glycosyltransferase n=1 Tax=Neoroseomonas marina TaxID=1232220 RepID=A0A848E8B3_9PROT|nr:glycosyltransferase family 2 protein [Neoroseomonas marina]NMJ39723.1 glycosyltransferase [Neoroseomonas marina]